MKRMLGFLVCACAGAAAHSSATDAVSRPRTMRFRCIIDVPSGVVIYWFGSVSPLHGGKVLIAGEVAGRLGGAGPRVSRAERALITFRRGSLRLLRSSPSPNPG